MAVTLPGLRKLITADELYDKYSTINTLGKHELARGQLMVKEPPGSMHGLVALSIGTLLRTYTRERAPGYGVFVETGFILARHPDTVRAPDVSVVTAPRMAGQTRASLKKYFEGAPDLAIEVLSPDDRWREQEDKIADYFSAGTRLVWMVDPQQQCVVVRTPDGQSKRLDDNDTRIDGGDVLPGFSAPVKMLLSTD